MQQAARRRVAAVQKSADVLPALAPFLHKKSEDTEDRPKNADKVLI